MDKKLNQPNSADPPYIGLIPFAEKDAGYFFGRKSDIEIAATNLRAASLTVFYGASGVGKSSLLNAGVAPYLQNISTGSILPGEPPEFILVVVREWANNPLESLRIRINEAIVKAVKEGKIPFLAMNEVDSTAAANKQNNDLCSLLKVWTDLIRTDLLIIFDQFEDFFLHSEFAAGEGSFGEEFPKALNNKNLPVNFLLSLRDDALGKLDFFKGKTPNLMKNTLRLLHLDRQATEEAIRCPLEKYNENFATAYSIEDELVKNLLDNLQVDQVKFETQGQAIVNQVEAATVENQATKRLAVDNRTTDSIYQVETPYLQLVMMKLWTETVNTQGRQLLTLETLKNLGGVQKIVESHLDEVMNEFTEDEKELAAKFIHFTVTRSGTKIPSSVSDLADWAELPDRKPEIDKILSKLTDKRVFKIVQNRREPKNRFYEVTHDALGPAILSWRKRENDTCLQKLAQMEAEAKSQKEIQAMEAARQAELEIENRHKEEQAAKLKEEQQKREYQETLLNTEKRSRKLGRLVWLLLAISTVAIVLMASWFFYGLQSKSDKKVSELSDNLELSKKKDIADKDINQKSNEEITKYYEERIDGYKSLIDILSELQSGKPKTIRVGLNRLKEKAVSGNLPQEYKPLLITTLKSTKIVPQDVPLRDETLAAIDQETKKIDKPTLINPTIIFIQIQNTDPKVVDLKALLEKNGYLAPGIENVGEQPSIKQIQLRYFRDGDAPLAGKISEFLKGHNIDAVPTRIGGYEDSPLVRQNQFELWFTGDPIDIK